MPAAFWSNTIWYVLLGVSTIVEMAFVLYKAKNRKHVVALFLIISGMTFSFEAIICCFLKAYEYYPMITPHSRIDDELAGNLFSQFSITATALLIAVLNLKYYWFLIIAVIYCIIEELFLRLGIYLHNWYQTWMTMLNVVILFEITKRLYKSNSIYFRNIWWYFYMSFGLYTLHMPIIWWIPILSGIIVPNTKILTDAMNSYALISLLNLIFLSVSCMSIYFSKLESLWKLTATIALYVVIYFAYKVNLIYVKEGWFIIFATIDILGMYLCVYILDKLMTKQS